MKKKITEVENLDNLDDVTSFFVNDGEDIKQIDAKKIKGNECLIATFNETPYTDIKDALDEGREVIVKMGDIYCYHHKTGENEEMFLSNYMADSDTVSFLRPTINTENVWGIRPYKVSSDNELRDLKTDITGMFNELSSNLLPYMLNIDYEEIEADKKFLIDRPGLYLFSGYDYDLNLYNFDYMGNNTYIVGKNNNLINVLFVTTNHNDGNYLRTFYGKTYKNTLGMSTMESGTVDLLNTKKAKAYIHNANSSNGALVYYIRLKDNK